MKGETERELMARRHQGDGLGVNCIRKVAGSSPFVAKYETYIFIFSRLLTHYFRQIYSNVEAIWVDLWLLVWIDPIN